MNAGLYFSFTYQSASASTRRPSASVLMISIVWPDMRLDDVARPLRLAVRHVLDEPQHADHIGLGLARGQRAHEAR